MQEQAQGVWQKTMPCRDFIYRCRAVCGVVSRPIAIKCLQTGECVFTWGELGSQKISWRVGEEATVLL